MTSAKQRRLTAMERGGYDLTGHHQKWVTITDYLRYDPMTGEILSTGYMSVGAVERLTAENGWSYLLQPAQLGIHFVDVSGSAPRRRARTACPASADGPLLKGLPVPCTVTVTDEAGQQTSVNSTEASLKLTFDYPGSYSVRVTCIPHTDAEFTLEA